MRELCQQTDDKFTNSLESLHHRYLPEFSASKESSGWPRKPSHLDSDVEYVRLLAASITFT